MMDPTSVFVSNLANTCKGSSFIKENGKKLKLFDRISDFFHGKHDYDHFKAVCEKLPGERLTDLSQDEQIEILGRIREIQSKIKNNSVKQECEAHIDRFESTVLNKENASECSQAIFNDLIESSKNHDKKKISADIRKFDALLNHYTNDPESITIIWKNWRIFYFEGSQLPLPDHTHFINANHQIVEKVLLKEEVILDNISGDQYQAYGFLFPAFLNLRFRNSDNRNFQERISAFGELMDKHVDDPLFIQNCLENIASILKNNGSHISEKKKMDFLLYQDFFPLIEKHLPTIENDELVQTLKIRCGNLPLKASRDAFPNLLLTEKDQINILVDRMQIKEDEIINKLVTALEAQTLSVHNISRLTKFANLSSNLSEPNRLKLKEALELYLDEAPENWDNYLHLKDQLENTDLVDPNKKTFSLEYLQRISKSKAFFQNQLDLDEEMIFIPRWHHATSKDSLTKILNSGEIQVRHERQFPGAWVSSKREERFGTHTIVLSHKISELDPRAFIGYRYEDRRWRGLQRPIPITSNLGGIAIGVPSDTDKTARKIEKLHLVKVLKEQGFPDPKALSVKQLDFMQNQFHEIMGTPNLSSRWW